MAEDMEAPSFSLGLDIDPEPYPFVGPTSTTPFEHENNGPQVMDSEEEEEVEVEKPRRVFKRLRRGGGGPMSKEEEVRGRAKREKPEMASVGCEIGDDDDIEEFSSQEVLVLDVHPSAQIHSVCSSSKVPLHGSVVITTQASSRWKVKNKEQKYDAPASCSLERGKNGLMFPKLTISPLRRFQLIDSDSECEEPSESEDLKRKNIANESSSKAHMSEQARKMSLGKQQNEDLWKDFLPRKSSCVSTPALDEFCDEYFQSLHNKNAAQGNDVLKNGKVACQEHINSETNFDERWNIADCLPPAHRYFFHEDPRIRKLVHSRLPNFSPLATGDNKGNQWPNESVIDYMGQFNGKASTQEPAQRRNSRKGSTKGRNKLKESNVEETSQAWVDPKSRTSIPKNAGTRRVHANDQAAGHWYTSQDGKKVYVSKSGQELTGQGAYRCYKKESGGSRKSRKKTNAKKERLKEKK